MSKLLVHLADSDHFSRSGIQGILEDSKNIEVEATYDSVEETIRGLANSTPGILLISDTLHTEDLLEDLSRINSANPQARAVFLANHLGAQQISRIYNAGCSGYVAKQSILNSDFASALNLIASGYTMFARPTDEQMFPSRSSLVYDLAAFIKEIDVRDKHIIVAVASGKRNSEIAVALHVSLGTVKQRIGRLMELFGVTNRVQLAVVAAEAGLVASVEI